VDHATVVEAIFAAETSAIVTPRPVVEAATARRLRDAFEPLSMHAVWSPLVHERLSAEGLDFFGTYVLGRGCVLGRPSGRVVAAAFAAFEPGLIAGIWDAAVAVVGVDEGRRLTFDSTAESLARVLEGADSVDIESVGARLGEMVDGLDPTGRPLFAGVQSLPWHEDPYGRLWQACLALREHRGDAHVAAYLGEGFDPVRMNILTELWLDYPVGEYSGTRAWPEEATAAAIAQLRADGLIDESDVITPRGTEVRDAIEARTDAMEQAVVDALGAHLDDIVSRLSEWSARCIEARTFPPDPRKRAAG